MGLNRDTPDDINPCCNLKGGRLKCLPYDDIFMIAAQVMPIIALIISCIWFVMIYYSPIVFILCQIPWCCRQKREGLIFSAIVAIAFAIRALWFPIYSRVESYYCMPKPIWLLFDGETNAYEDCEIRSLCAIVIVIGCLWLATGCCIFYFVVSGRHAKWEKFHSNPGGKNDTDDDDDNAGAAEQGSDPVEECETVVATAVEVLDPAPVVATAAVLPSAPVDPEIEDTAAAAILAPAPVLDPEIGKVDKTEYLTNEFHRLEKT